MPFTQETFSPVGPQSTQAPAAFSYKTTDSINDVLATGYFEPKSQQLREGDVIFTYASDGFYILIVSADTSTVAPFSAVITSSVIVETDQNYQLSVLDDFVVGRGAGNIEFTLPLIAQATKAVTIRNDGAGNITINGNGASTEAEVVTPNQSATLLPTSYDMWVVV